jgi:hypothetical protein
VLDVLVGELQLFTTQAQLVTGEHDTAIAEFNVAAAIGRLIAPDLRPPVRLYDMDRHCRTVKDKWIGFASGLKEQRACVRRIAVGMLITGHPPHRTGGAAFPFWRRGALPATHGSFLTSMGLFLSSGCFGFAVSSLFGAGRPFFVL